MNPSHLTCIALFAASKRLGGVRVHGRHRVFTHVHRTNNGVTCPVHTVTNTYELNRDVLISKQNRVTTGPNTNSIVSQYDYTVNAIGQRVSRTQSGTAFDGIGYAPGSQLPPTMTGVFGSGTTTDVFNYNTRGEVINSTNNLASNFNRSYSYDPIGNRLAATEGDINNPATNSSSKTYNSNALNQYTQINTSTQPAPSVETTTYDADGNMLTDGTGKTYTWDCENRLIQVILQGDKIVKHYYDSNSRRTKRENITSLHVQTNTFLYNDWNVICEMSTGLLRPNNDSSGRTVKTYVWGLDLSNSLQSLGGIGGLLSNKITHVDSNQLFFFLYDANGNVTEMLNSEGVILANYFYDAFGNEISSSGNFSNENIFQMGTKIRNNFAGLVYYGYRFYSADFGRWINRDPIEELGNVNNCNFSANNLINRQDLLGLKCCLLTIEPRWKIGKNFSFAGHSMLECGDDPKDPSYMYISYFPGNKKHTRTQDEDDYGGWNFNGKNKTKTSKGFTITRDCLADCLDEKKVLEFYKKYQQADFPDWTKCSNNCSDTMTNAIIAALDNTKPVCPCGESLWDFMVREGINKSQIYNSPSDTRDAVQDIIRYNNCRRYACRKDTEMTTPGSERKPLPPPYFPKKD